MITETDLALDDGRLLHVYDGGEGQLAVFWHHGTPNIGAPPEPLFATAARLGIRWIGYDRPGYGGSSPAPGRTVGSAATYVERVADSLGIDRFAVMGHSGGGSLALACAAILRDRVIAAVSIAGLAPFDAPGLDWFAGMGPSGSASLHAAANGRAAKERHEATATQSPPDFTPEDWTTLEGEWSWFGKVVRPAMKSGPAPLIDDDLAYVAPWGCDPADVTAPVLLVHGGRDQIVPSAHGVWLAKRCRAAELWLRPEESHISVLRFAGPALDWLSAHVDDLRPHGET